MFKNSDANLFHSKNLLVETYCAAQSSVLYGIANYNPPATGNLYQSKDWRSPTCVFLFCWAPEVISKSKSPWGTESVTVYSLSYCIVSVYLCPIRTLSLLRVFKITLQIYMIASRYGGNNGKQTIVYIVVYTGVPEYWRDVGACYRSESKLNITIGNFLLAKWQFYEENWL